MLRRGAKTTIAALADETPSRELAQRMRDEWFLPEALERVIALDAGWWHEHLTPAKRVVGEYPHRVAARHGARKLRESPRVFVGTIHSLKGSEADSVYLMPDLSVAGYQEWRGSPERQAGIHRLFYVGITRARERLTVCAPSGGRFVEFEMPEAIAA